MTPTVSQLESKPDSEAKDQKTIESILKYFGDKWYVLSYLVIVFAIFSWVSMASKTVSLFLFFFLCILISLFLFSGKVILNLLEIKKLKVTFATSFIVGFICLNSFSYLIYLFSDLNVLYSYIIGIIFAVGLKCFYVKRFKKNRQFCLKQTDSEDSFICLITVLFIILGVTLWSQQSLNPVIIKDNNVIYKPWNDSFVHARFISGISDSDGFRNLQNRSLAGENASFYHYAYYFLPSLVKKVSSIDAFSIYCGFLVPFGLFLTCITAFAFIENLFDSFAAFISCFLIVVVPSASQMGLSNEWFNYHWLLQVSPGLSYGIAVIAIAWLFMIVGCKNSYYRLILIGWFVAVLSINYRAQIFVANAFLIFLFPTLFLPEISTQKRVTAFFSFLSIYILAIIASWSVDSFPLIKFDGSAFRDYSSFILNQFESPVIKKIFSTKINSGNFPLDTLVDILFMSFVVFINTFGVMGLLYFVFNKYKKIDFVYRILPLLFIINYIIMALSMAHNVNRGTWEEFMHRPFVWAYFILTIFIGGYLSIYLKPYLKNIEKSKVKPAIVIIPFVFLVIPLLLGSHITRGPVWGSDLINNKIDRGLYDVAKYIEKHSSIHDIIQYSRDDDVSYLTAVSERQSFVNKHKFVQNIPAELKQRHATVQLILSSKNKKQFNDILEKNKIKWFVFHKDDAKNIPEDLADGFIYKSNGYLLFAR